MSKEEFVHWNISRNALSLILLSYKRRDLDWSDNFLKSRLDIEEGQIVTTRLRDPGYLGPIKISNNFSGGGFICVFTPFQLGPLSLGLVLSPSIKVETACNLKFRLRSQQLILDSAGNKSLRKQIYS